jgi:hypothetical protein
VSPAAGIAHIDVDQLIGPVVGLRAEEHCVDDGEDRRIGADAERQDSDGDGGESGRLVEAAEGVAEVLYKPVHVETSSVAR